MNIRQEIKKLAADAGYIVCGVTTADPFPEFEREIRDRMTRFPEAADLYSWLLKRVDPRASNPWASSIIACVNWYGRYRVPEGLAGHIGRHYLFDRRVKACPENAIPRRMTAGLRELGLRVRRGGVPDRWAGARAGVTRFGRNCFAYSPEHGSWITVETWLVDAELPPDEPTVEPACPEGCRACMEACPTKALAEPFKMRWDRCVAHLTYRYPEPVPEELWSKMGKWIYGCDVCQEVCPMNKGAWQPTKTASWIEDVAHLLQPEALAEMDAKTYAEVVHPLFWYIPLDNLERWHRNAKRALGND